MLLVHVRTSDDDSRSLVSPLLTFLSPRGSMALLATQLVFTVFGVFRWDF